LTSAYAYLARSPESDFIWNLFLPLETIWKR